ncbi:MAG: HD domain-containing protein [Armatimonadota bacterium]
MAWFCSIRDPIHDFIGLDELECKIVNTCVFQRLRGIHQLAMAYLVYPGALHTRFDHSLGVCHIAGLLADQLQLGAAEKRLVRLAALLHDIGHGPFSHVSENSLDRFSDRAALGKRVKTKEKVHEVLTLDVINTDTELCHILSGRDRETITKLLREGHGEPVLKDIISGPLDADKQDYLLRDSMFCGVRYGVFDLSQLHRSLVAEKNHDDTCLMVKDTGVHALEQFVLAKYYLTTQIYRHRVRLITDSMLTRAIALGITEDGIEELKKLYSYDGKPEFIENYAKWNDARFLLTYGSDEFKGTLCYGLVRRLCSRDLLKRVYGAALNDKQFSQPEVLYALLNLNMEQRASIERGVAEVLSKKWGFEVNPDYVIVNIHTIKSVREQSRNDEESILVEDRPRPTPFEEKSTLFRSIDESLNERFIEVYAPAKYETDAERRGILKGIMEDIGGVIESVLSGKGETR